MSIKSYLKSRIYILVLIALGALVVGFPYIFPTPTYQDLENDCMRQCEKLGAAWKLEKESVPYSPKFSSANYSCHCLK